jgi:GNAT superfamily N-acetyltransferase
VYDGPYAAYNCPADEVDDFVRGILDPDNHYYAVRDEGGGLVGYCCFGPDARVPGGEYADAADPRVRPEEARSSGDSSMAGASRTPGTPDTSGIPGTSTASGGPGESGTLALDVGLGLRPDLIGRGLGAGFLDAISTFAARQLGHRRLRVTVAAWNLRAIRLYEKAGFRTGHTFTRDTPSGRANGSIEWVQMTRDD